MLLSLLHFLHHIKIHCQSLLNIIVFDLTKYRKSNFASKLLSILKSFCYDQCQFELYNASNAAEDSFVPFLAFQQKCNLGNQRRTIFHKSICFGVGLPPIRFAFQHLFLQYLLLIGQYIELIINYQLPFAEVKNFDFTLNFRAE